MKHQIMPLLLAIIHAASGLILLIFSSWFIAACAVAGVNFNYMLPAVIIRALALLRIASGYAQMWLGHQQLLKNVATIRLNLFEQFTHRIINKRAIGVEALAQHSEAVASVWIAWIAQNASAVMMLFIGQAIVLIYLPSFTYYFVSFIVTYFILFAWLCLKGITLSMQLLECKNAFRFTSEHHLNAASLWHMQTQVSHNDATALWQLKNDLDDLSEKALLTLQLVSFILLVMMFVLFIPDAFLATQGNIEVGIENDTESGALFLIIIMLFLSAKDWLSSVFYAQPAASAYLQGKKSLDHIPAETIQQLDESVAQHISGNGKKVTQLTLIDFQAARQN